MIWVVLYVVTGIAIGTPLGYVLFGLLAFGCAIGALNEASSR